MNHSIARPPGQLATGTCSVCGGPISIFAQADHEPWALMLGAKFIMVCLTCDGLAHQIRWQNEVAGAKPHPSLPSEPASGPATTGPTA